jgi:hypothetical protein
VLPGTRGFSIRAFVASSIKPPDGYNITPKVMVGTIFNALSNEMQYVKRSLKQDKVVIKNGRC